MPFETHALPLCLRASVVNLLAISQPRAVDGAPRFKLHIVKERTESAPKRSACEEQQLCDGWRRFVARFAERRCRNPAFGNRAKNSPSPRRRNAPPELSRHVARLIFANVRNGAGIAGRQISFILTATRIGGPAKEGTNMAFGARAAVRLVILLIGASLATNAVGMRGRLILFQSLSRTSF
jgi:hypothetical protein